MRILPLTTPKGWLKKRIRRFVNKTQILSNKVCYIVSFCKNFQQQSCNVAVPLYNGP